LTPGNRQRSLRRPAGAAQGTLSAIDFGRKRKRMRRQDFSENDENNLIDIYLLFSQKNHVNLRKFEFSINSTYFANMQHRKFPIANCNEIRKAKQIIRHRRSKTLPARKIYFFAQYFGEILKIIFLLIPGSHSVLLLLELNRHFGGMTCLR
jgi:hypothetical protein